MTADIAEKGGAHIGEERGEDVLVAAHVDSSVQSLHLLLVLRQRVLEHVTLDVQILVLRLPGDTRGQRSPTDQRLLP